MGKFEDSVKQIINDIDAAPVGAVENVKGSFLISLSNMLKELLESREASNVWAPTFEIDTTSDPTLIKLTMKVGDKHYYKNILLNDILQIRDDDYGIINFICADLAHEHYKNKLKDLLSEPLVKVINNARAIKDFK